MCFDDATLRVKVPRCPGALLSCGCGSGAASNRARLRLGADRTDRFYPLCTGDKSCLSVRKFGPGLDLCRWSNRCRGVDARWTSKGVSGSFGFRPGRSPVSVLGGSDETVCRRHCGSYGSGSVDKRGLLAGCKMRLSKQEAYIGGRETIGTKVDDCCITSDIHFRLAPSVSPGPRGRAQRSTTLQHLIHPLCPYATAPSRQS